MICACEEIIDYGFIDNLFINIFIYLFKFNLNLNLNLNNKAFVN